MLENQNIIIIWPSKVIELAVKDELSFDFFENKVKSSWKSVSNEFYYFLSSDLLNNYKVFLPKENNEFLISKIENFFQEIKNNKKYITEEDIIEEFSTEKEIIETKELLKKYINEISYNNGSRIINWNEMIEKIEENYTKNISILYEFILILFNTEILYDMNELNIMNSIVFELYNFNEWQSQVFLENQFLDTYIDLKIHYDVFKKTEVKWYFNIDRLQLNFDFRKIYLSYILSMYWNSNHVFDLMLPDDMLFFYYIQRLFIDLSIKN